MQIGAFTLSNDGGWTGSIRTLTIDAKVRLVPNDDRTHDNAPAFRVLVSNARIGDAWEARTTGDNPKYYLRVRLDDPSLSERSEEHTSELQSLMRISYAVFCLKKKKQSILKSTYDQITTHHNTHHLT